MDSQAVADGYSTGTLWDRLVAALVDDGVDPTAPTVTELSHYDQFHGRGLESTASLADSVEVSVDDHLLDVGSGLGGPARYFAQRFGCRVSGIDLTPEFCDVASRLTTATGLNDLVTIDCGSALDMPFVDDSFDGVFSMNVSMNIADRELLHREIHRVIRPGGWLVLSELARGTNATPPTYPLPWAQTAGESFLISPDDTCESLRSAGFVDVGWTDVSEQTSEFAARTRAAIEAGERPVHRTVAMVHPNTAATAARNLGSASRNRQVVPIVVRCRRAP